MAKGTDITLDSKSIAQLSSRIERKIVTTNQGMEAAVADAAYMIDEKAKDKIKLGTRSGRTYTRGKISHQASAPGEPPKTDTGRFISSIHTVFHTTMNAEVGSLQNIAVYGAMLETGTRNMEPRPWLEPTLKENADAITKIFANAIKGGGLAT